MKNIKRAGVQLRCSLCGSWPSVPTLEWVFKEILEVFSREFWEIFTFSDLFFKRKTVSRYWSQVLMHSVYFFLSLSLSSGCYCYGKLQHISCCVGSRGCCRCVRQGSSLAAYHWTTHIPIGFIERKKKYNQNEFLWCTLTKRLHQQLQ